MTPRVGCRPCVFSGVHLVCSPPSCHSHTTLWFLPISLFACICVGHFSHDRLSKTLGAGKTVSHMRLQWNYAGHRVTRGQGRPRVHMLHSQDGPGDSIASSA